jgi:hypothetical protein
VQSSVGPPELVDEVVDDVVDEVVELVVSEVELVVPLPPPPVFPVSLPQPAPAASAPAVIIAPKKKKVVRFISSMSPRERAGPLQTAARGAAASRTLRLARYCGSDNRVELA